jgi:large subunit ribosomal protein L13
LKEKTAAQMKQEDSTFVIREAVRGMLPTNKLSRDVLSKLKMYTGAEHPHAAQKPEVYTVSTGKKD